jgi:hypothetical protein
LRPVHHVFPQPGPSHRETGLRDTWGSASRDGRQAGARELGGNGPNGQPGTSRSYANDLGDPRDLIAVTARSNRSKADQDPSTWLPPAGGYRCTYVTDRITDNLRRGLDIDHLPSGATAGDARLPPQGAPLPHRWTSRTRHHRRIGRVCSVPPPARRVRRHGDRPHGWDRRRLVYSDRRPAIDRPVRGNWCRKYGAPAASRS